MRDRKNVLKFPDLSAVEAEAAEWVVKLERGCSAEDLACFREWQDRSPANREAGQRLTALWSQFDLLARYAAQPPAVEEKAPRRFLPIFASGGVPLWRTVGVVAAILIVVICRTAYFSRPQPVVTTTIYQASIGSQQEVTLPDGTSVTLNSGSQIEVAYSGTYRDVRLRRGEAYFEVAHTDSRPFTVLVGDRKVHDIGTEFDVCADHRAVEVIVAKGAVELLAPPSSNAAPGERLGVVQAGQRAAFDHRLEYLQSMSAADINRKLAWRDGILIYAGEPLSHVVEDVSRYSDIHIMIADPALKDIPVGGYFEIRKIRGVFSALEANFGIHAAWLDATHVRLTTNQQAVAKSTTR
jgi:transmembrane sensor